MLSREHYLNSGMYTSPYPSMSIKALFFRDFRETAILVDFHSSLEASLPSQLTESGLYIGKFYYVVIFVVD